VFVIEVKNIGFVHGEAEKNIYIHNDVIAY